jgi:hypothetical protein
MPVPTNEPPGPLTPWPVPPEVNEVSQTCDVTYCTVNEVTATRLMPFSAAASTTSMTRCAKVRGLRQRQRHHERSRQNSNPFAKPHP